MANEYGQERVYRVYKIMHIGSAGAIETAYGLVQVRNFEGPGEAELWIHEEGDRHTDYTILEVVRNR